MLMSVNSEQLVRRSIKAVKMKTPIESLLVFRKVKQHRLFAKWTKRSKLPVFNIVTRWKDPHEDEIPDVLTPATRHTRNMPLVHYCDST